MMVKYRWNVRKSTYTQAQKVYFTVIQFAFFCACFLIAVSYNTEGLRTV